MRHFLAAALVMLGFEWSVEAQTTHVPALTSFYSDCLRDGGSPASVGDYENVVVMPIYNGKFAVTGAGLWRFSITVAPSTNKEAAAVFEREPIPQDESADFIVRQGRTHFLSATRLRMLRTEGGRLDLCIRQF